MSESERGMYNVVLLYIYLHVYVIWYKIKMETGKKIMITTMVIRKRGLTDSVSCPDDGDPWAPNNLLKIWSKRKRL